MRGTVFPGLAWLEQLLKLNLEHNELGGRLPALWGRNGTWLSLVDVNLHSNRVGSGCAGSGRGPLWLPGRRWGCRATTTAGGESGHRSCWGAWVWPPGGHQHTACQQPRPPARAPPCAADWADPRQLGRGARVQRPLQHGFCRQPAEREHPRGVLDQRRLFQRAHVPQPGHQQLCRPAAAVHQRPRHNGAASGLGQGRLGAPQWGAVAQVCRPAHPAAPWPATCHGPRLASRLLTHPPPTRPSPGCLQDLLSLDNNRFSGPLPPGWGTQAFTFVGQEINATQALAVVTLDGNQVQRARVASALAAQQVPCSLG